VSDVFSDKSGLAMTLTNDHTNDAESGGWSVDGRDADEWGQYRSLSSLAVVAFVLGLCSLLTFVSPLMLVVPLAAVAAALLALKGISASAGSLSGGKLALVGLTLAICFSTASFARLKIRDRILQQQADRVGRQWLALAAQGRSEDMLPLMSKAAVDKLSPTEPAQQPMSFFGDVFAKALLRQDSLVVSLSNLGTADEIRLRLKETGTLAEATPPQAFFHYVAGMAESEQAECSIVLKRFQVGELETAWLVDSWQLE